MDKERFDHEQDPVEDVGYEDVPEEFFVFEDAFEEREPTVIDRIKAYAMVAIALIVVLGLINLSGLYQTFRFFETPASVLEKATETPADLAPISVPLTFFIVRGANGSERTSEDIDQLMRNGQSIWDQANIVLEQKAVHELVLSEEDAELFFQDPSAFKSAFISDGEEGISVVLVRSLRGINGIAYTNLDMIGVADLTTIFDFRAFAHEIGHILSLPHTEGRSRLMHREANSIEIIKEEIMAAREAARERSYGSTD